MKAIVQLRSCMMASASAKLKGTPCCESDVSILLNDDCDVYKPNGEFLCMLRRNSLSAAVMEQAHPSLRALRNQVTDNRGAYTGRKRTHDYTDGKKTKNLRTRDEDGKLISVRSAIVGFFDRQRGRHPFCRSTAFTANQVDKWEALQPMIKEVSMVFKANGGQRYREQQAITDRTQSAYIIKDTPFTTLTVNNNVVAATHKDAGDFKEGMGIISVSRKGHYEGAWLIFPEFGVGADLQDRDVIFFNSHDWHGVTPFRNEDEEHERISVVYYFREGMVKCGTPEEEIDNARRVRGTL